MHTHLTRHTWPRRAQHAPKHVPNCDDSQEECDQELQAVHCYHHACALRKAQPEGDHVDVQRTGGKYSYPHVHELRGTH